MKKQAPLGSVFTDGLWKNNPVMKQVLAMCPVLAVTVSAENGIAMGLATTFVLVSASTIVSLVRSWIPSQVRIASYILVIATFVTIVDYVMKAQFLEMSKALGPFIPLIIVNCLILGRQEAFASKNPPHRAILDALGMGVGLTMTLFVLGGIREILGSRELLGTQVLPDAFEPWIVMILPAGAFLTLGFMFAVANAVEKRKEDLAREEVYRKHYRPDTLEPAAQKEA
ncbi:MAG: RnfABCDGE type electron transport complex subunit E [Ignavibacteriales bacterium]|nr:RnfABCDGE type electron transport complex subunit E [Ignavibacteriales bacterium]